LGRTSLQNRGARTQQGLSNYLIGDRQKWRTDIPNYARVQYDEAIPELRWFITAASDGLI
jgi:hypothetical protein